MKEALDRIADSIDEVTSELEALEECLHEIIDILKSKKEKV